MQSWQTVVVCVAVSVVVVSRGALAHPRALEDSVLGSVQLKENVDEKQPWFPAENNGKIPEEEAKKISRSASQEQEEVRKMNIVKDDQLGIPREFLAGNAEEKDELVKAAKVESGPDVKIEQKEDDSIRSKKSPDMREMSYHPHPMTTVCIQVRSDHRPSVVCGPQVGEDKPDDKTGPASAPRYASSDPYNPRNAQGQQGGRSPQLFPGKSSGLYMRVSPGDLEQFSPSSALRPLPQRGMAYPQKQTDLSPIMSPASPLSPKAARGPYVRTQPEDDNTLKPSEGTQSSVPTQPLRIIPQGPSPSSILVHRQYYQAAPMSPFPSSLIPSAPSATPLRFNCALQPDGAQFVQTYGSPLMRNSAGALLPMSGEIISPDVPSRIAQGIANMQGYYVSPQGRSAQPEDAMEYADPWVGTTFVGDDGQLYQIDDSQARAAVDEQESPRPSSGMTVEELRVKYSQQDDQLKKSSEKIQQLDKKLREMQRSLAEEDDKKKHTPPAEPSKEHLVVTAEREREPTETEEHKKPTQNKNTKRHSFQHMTK